ncbi:hypothetical protein A3842_09165 [Paenibacillus sp. P3E]|nr:hypothetical protein A3842_09165 [Paenibacillus sp. P3E]
MVHYFEKFGVDTQHVIEENFSFIILDVAGTERGIIDKANEYTSSQLAFANVDPVVTRLTPVIKDLLSVTKLVSANLAYETRRD